MKALLEVGHELRTFSSEDLCFTTWAHTNAEFIPEWVQQPWLSSIMRPIFFAENNINKSVGCWLTTVAAPITPLKRSNDFTTGNLSLICRRLSDAATLPKSKTRVDIDIDVILLRNRQMNRLLSFKSKKPYLKGFSPDDFLVVEKNIA